MRETDVEQSQNLIKIKSNLINNSKNFWIAKQWHLQQEKKE